MRLYLYAIAEGLDSIGDVTGVQQEALTVTEVGPALVVGGWVADLPSLNRETLVAQDSVVRALHARANALLPMRFGSSVVNVEALTRLLDPLAPRVAECCALVRGREQMTVRVLRTRTGGGGSAEGASGAEGAEGAGAEGAWGAESAEGAAEQKRPGTRYLEKLAAKRAPPEVTRLLEAVRVLQRAARIEPGRDPTMVATVYHLIDRGESDEYRRRLEPAVATLVNLTVRVSGPAPAYAFAVLSAP